MEIPIMIIIFSKIFNHVHPYPVQILIHKSLSSQVHWSKISVLETYRITKCNNLNYAALHNITVHPLKFLVQPTDTMMMHKNVTEVLLPLAKNDLLH